MNTVSSYFATIVAFLVVAIGWWAADAEICCNSNSVASGGGDIVASCQNNNRTFHTVETNVGVDKCDDNWTAVPIRKCCPFGQWYDTILKLCRLSGMGGDEHLQRMMKLLRDQSDVVFFAMMVGYNFEQPLCDNGIVLVSVSTDEVRRLLGADTSKTELPPGYCFDLTPSNELVALTCHAAALVCCNSSSIASGGGDVVASCQNKNRTFHTVETNVGVGKCDENWTALLVQKCCLLGQSYDTVLKLCRLTGMGDNENLQRMMKLLRDQSAVVDYATMVGYNYEQPLCDAGYVLVDVNTEDLSGLLKAYSSWIPELPPGYCFDLTPSNELVALTCHAAAVVCCNSSSVESAGGDVVASCQNKKRTFHTVEAFGDGMCDDNRTAVSIRKCCAWGQYYDFNQRTCQPIYTYTDRQWMMQQLMQLLRYKAREVADAVMVGYNYEELLCGGPNEIVKKYAFDVILMSNKPLKFPEKRCFDLTTDGYPIAQVCRRKQHCLENTCIRRCCKGDRMIVDGSNGPECTVNEKPFRMFAYEIDEDGRQVGRSNKTVLPYYEEFKCSHRDMLEYGFQLTEDGDLYLTYENHLVTYTEYCVGYSQGIVTDTIVAYICDADTVFMDKRAARASSIHLFYRASYVASAVCLAFTLLLYNTLPSLRNTRNYSVKCYVHHQFVSCICVIYQMSMEKEKKKEKCLLFGYITLFVFLSTLCWLNVICFDIYRMIRYNISRNRNTSTSVRTVMYHFYCLGLPSIFVCTCFFFLISHDESLEGLAPIFEVTGYGCFYHMPGYGDLFFIPLPVFVMLAANLIFFLLTAIHYSRMKSELNKFNPADSKTENFLVYKEKFVMSIKLFLIIGIPYLLTVLSIILRNEVAKWNIIYAASSLQGVLIFIIFVAKHQVIMDLRKKFKGSMDHSEPTQINLISGSSQ